uniref:Uncharacterized protein n=1 Tax=Setaria viridis TaxID=4556 RepID=A0A4U6VR74_SETVI|nr:hypothetical protein SEVIR_2G163200v2 [Setaria viridis]
MSRRAAGERWRKGRAGLGRERGTKEGRGSAVRAAWDVEGRDGGQHGMWRAATGGAAGTRGDRVEQRQGLPVADPLWSEHTVLGRAKVEPARRAGQRGSCGAAARAAGAAIRRRIRCHMCYPGDALRHSSRTPPSLASRVSAGSFG